MDYYIQVIVQVVIIPPKTIIENCYLWTMDMVHFVHFKEFLALLWSILWFLVYRLYKSMVPTKNVGLIENCWYLARLWAKLGGHAQFKLRSAGVLHENFAEIGFLVVSDRGDRYLSDAFLAKVKTTLRLALQCNCIACAIFNCMPWKSTLKIYLLLQFLKNHLETLRICSRD